MNFDIKEMLNFLFNKNDIKLTEVQEKIDNINNKKNVLILSSCGSGKTEVAYYLSKVWGDKFIYALPMKTLANSICDRLNKYEEKLNGLSNSNYKWTIQHSGISGDKFLSNKMSVATIDQVLSGYLAIGVQSFIRGKNVVNSDLVFDEIQLFEPGKMLKTTICMLDSLFKQGNRFCIMTATMPKSLIEFLSNRYDMEVIITQKPSVESRMINLSYVDKLSLKDIESFNNKQIIICNTQKEQIDIYNQIENKERVILLNNKLVQDDRELVEKEVIKYFGKDSNDNNKILISTQILEAGFDISAPKVYSSLCPIDNLVQRDGRCSRWGGKGNLIVFEGDCSIYRGDELKSICMNTLKYIKENNGIEFNWDIQKKWIDDILSDYYSNELTEYSIKQFKNSLKDGNSNTLIRQVETVNLIVLNDVENINKIDFYRMSVPIHIGVLEKLSKTNRIFTLDRNVVKEDKFHNFMWGGTYIINGIDCKYDLCGFRYEENCKATTFDFHLGFSEKHIINNYDYKEESWLIHALNVKNIFEIKLLKNNRVGFSKEQILRYSYIAGLHDLGKLTIAWQNYIGSNKVLLAHNCYGSRNVNLIKDYPHKFISAVSIREYLNDFEFNMIINHHGREISRNSNKEIKEYKFKRGTNNALKRYGFRNKLNLNKYRSKREDLNIRDKDIYTPKSDDWCKLLVVVGVLMEADIEAIKKFNNNEIFIG
ncbi:CRISPR-associated helicase Cas3' [Clostridium perfringens]|uniref:CRISPR-associated helicase Cas3' n=1 Tax=Clostridium perfringens TaxID=1502 RepID=UPI0024BC1F27|nr:CRISPR-associated helicase Cas3' [Clostridium perfringens]